MSEENFEIWWDSELKIIRVRLIGPQDEVGATLIADKELQMMDFVKEQDICDYKVLYDLSKAGKATVTAKRILASFAKKIAQDFPDVKVAYVGGPKLAVMASKFIHKISGMGKIKYFKDEGSAIKWLKSI